MWFDHLVAYSLAPLALWILLSGLDDLWIDLVFLWTARRRFAWPDCKRRAELTERPIAILVPLWREHPVIARMLAHNLEAIRYRNYQVFVGVYPNDPETVQAVERVARQDGRVHVCLVPHDGPTSKGDCLNWTYRAMETWEAGAPERFEIIMTHDAEDLVHPESLSLINWYSRDYEMVQVPVLPLATPVRELMHGLYCDEFAEFQSKDIPVRQMLGGFLPANGVGTGFDRGALETVALANGGAIFDPDCLTEDYENGYRLYAAGYRQIFLPLHFEADGPVATREYFPRTFRAAIRQRSRWVAGIVLQGWERHGWGGPWPQDYWFWRDRKGLVGNLLSPLANFVLLYGAASYGWSVRQHVLWNLGNLIPAWVLRVCLATWWMSMAQIAIRAGCSARIYGWRFAMLSPVRTLWGNVVNWFATAAAIRQFASARVKRKGLAWRKTDHVYPRPRLGELLAQRTGLAAAEVEAMVLRQPKGVRLGEYLVRLEKVTEEDVYGALGEQAGLPEGLPRHVEHAVTRSFPAEAVRKWKVMPYRVDRGRLHVMTTDVPSAEMERALKGLSALEIRFRLVRPREFAEAAERYLGW